MSEEQFKAFQAAVQADAGLQEQLKAAGDADAVVAIAKAAGYGITAEDLEGLRREELTERDLEAAAGGAPGPSIDWRLCF